MKLVLRYVRPYSLRLGIGMSVKLLGTVIELFIPYILAYIIDEVTPKNDLRLVILWGFAMLGCALVTFIANVMANRSAAAVARDTTENVRHDLFKKIIFLSNRQVDAYSIPSLISRMTTDTYNIHRMVGMMQRIGVRAPIMIIGGVIVTMILDPALALVLLIVMPLLFGIVIFISKKSLPMFHKLQITMDKMVRVVRETATGVRVIKALGREEHEKERFRQVNLQVVKDENRANMTMALSNPIMNLLLNGGLVIMIIVGAYQVNSGASDVGKIIAFMTYFTVILQAIMGITRVLTVLSQTIASANRIDEIMQTEPEMHTAEKDQKESEWHLEFDNVSFSYDKKAYDIRSIDFGLKRGESLGVIGQTGAGKSTLAALMMRFYDIDEGAIRIAGEDICGMELEELRAHFGVVFQNDAVFKNTIAGNIHMGREISMQDIENATKIAQAASFIEEAGGFEHAVEAKGTNLSGGQKQRLLIARALAGRPDILILDDSSSALDYKTDALLREGMRREFSGITTVIVAQRVSSIKHCDKIMVLDEGAILDLGSHDELMQSCDMYKEIYDLQMGNVEEVKSSAG